MKCLNVVSHGIIVIAIRQLLSTIWTASESLKKWNSAVGWVLPKAVIFSPIKTISFKLSKNSASKRWANAKLVNGPNAMIVIYFGYFLAIRKSAFTACSLSILVSTSGRSWVLFSSPSAPKYWSSHLAFGRIHFEHPLYISIFLRSI